MTRYSLFVLKVPLNAKKTNQTNLEMAAIISQSVHVCETRESLLVAGSDSSVRPSTPPVNEAGADSIPVPPAEFPGILEGHGEGRIPGRVGPDASENSPPGNTAVRSG